MGPACAGCGAGFTGDPLAPGWTCARCGRANVNEMAMEAAMCASAAAGAEPPALPGPRAVVEDHPCLTCGYVLRGLGAGAMCPECGTPVARSLRGNLLEFASPEYVRSLARGSLLALVGVCLFFVDSALFIGVHAARDAGHVIPYLPVRSQDVLLDMLSFVSSCVSLVGWWMLSAPDPASSERAGAGRARRVLRVLLVVSVAGAVGDLLISMSVIPVPTGTRAGRGIVVTPATFSNANATLVFVFQTVVFLVEVVRFFASVVYVRTLTPRIPDQSLDRYAKICLWLVPLLMTVLLVPTCGLGLLAGVVLYVILVTRLWRRLRGVVARMGAQTAGAPV